MRIIEGFGLLFIGIVFIFQGLGILFIKGYRLSWWGHYTYGPYPSIAGVVLVVGGAVFAYKATKAIIKSRRNDKGRKK